MNSISTIIKKSILALTAGVSAIVLTLPNSIAYVQPSPAVSAMTEPVPSYIFSEEQYKYHFVWITYRDGSTTQDGYNIHIVDITSPSPVEWLTSPYWFYSSNNFSYHIDRFDLDGNILQSGDYSAGYNSYQNYYQGNLRYNLTNNSGWYFIAPSELNCYSQSEPFVTFSVKPPEHNQYHSHLSEPVADKFNRYFIIDDKLYWVSFRINGAYVLTSDVMTEQDVESYTSNGEYIGAISSTSNSLISMGSQVTYQDMEMYPVNFKSEQFFDDDLVYLSLYYNTSGSDLRLDIDRLGLVRALSTDRLYLETELYYSVFNLEDGSYVESKFFENDGFVTSHLSLNAGLPSSIADVKCYGIAFLNAGNLPVNLSDVLWEYDIEFAEWRDRLETMLERIYQSLAGENVETETYTQPSWNNDLNQAEPNTYISDNEMLSVFDAGFDSVKPSPEGQLSITSWVDMFSVPKLIAACCFALAMGTIILTLGKKKSD